MANDICQYFYKITLITPAGKRYGHLQMEVERGVISGCIDILKHKSDISGQVLDHGKCRLTGTLISLMKKVAYTAVGHFDSQRIELTLEGTRNHYHLTGIAARRN